MPGYDDPGQSPAEGVGYDLWRKRLSRGIGMAQYVVCGVEL